MHKSTTNENFKHRYYNIVYYTNKADKNVGTYY